MTGDFDVLDGPAEAPHTITVFGDNDSLDHALTQELGRRGRRTHTVTVATGWLRSASHAILRIDTASGAIALRELTSREHPLAHVVAICEQPLDQHDTDRFREMCRQCGQHHDVSLIWHPPMQPEPPPYHDGIQPAQELPAIDLAVTVADAVEERALEGGAPSFEARTFEPSHS
jgi:hypothetical protein